MYWHYFSVLYILNLRREFTRSRDVIRTPANIEMESFVAIVKD